MNRFQDWKNIIMSLAHHFTDRKSQIQEIHISGKRLQNLDSKMDVKAG